MSTPPRTGQAAGRWRVFFLAALTVLLALLLPASTASAEPVSAAGTRVGVFLPAAPDVVGVHESITAGQHWVRGPSQLRLVVGHCVAAKTGAGEATTLFRAVGQREADNIAASGGYRNAPGLEGKYFFPTRAQAEQYGQMMNKAPGFGAPNYLTSGSIPSSALSAAEGMQAGSEGAGLFFRGDPSSFFNVVNHGLIP